MQSLQVVMTTMLYLEIFFQTLVGNSLHLMDMKNLALHMKVFLTPVLYLCKDLWECLIFLKGAFFLQSAFFIETSIILFSNKHVTNLMNNM